MAMSVAQEGDDEETPMSEINTTPLVDVMLVLLIVFLITVPVATAQKPVTLPSAANISTMTKPEFINIAIEANGDVYVGMTKYETPDLLRAYVRSRATEKPQPEVHIKADKEVRYEFVGRTVFAVQRGGIQKVGFITSPLP